MLVQTKAEMNTDCKTNALGEKLTLIAIPQGTDTNAITYGILVIM